MPDTPAGPVPGTPRALADAVRRGDHAAFEAIFRAHYDGLVRFANRLLLARMEAEEVVQDVLLKVWTKREQLDPGEDLKTYLYRATRNQALNQLRRRRVERLFRRTRPADEPEAPPPPPAGASQEATELAVAIAAAVEALPDRCREVFVLSREHGLTYSAIAATMGISVKTVETQMGRAFRSLRAALGPFRERNQ